MVRVGACWHRSHVKGGHIVYTTHVGRGWSAEALTIVAKVAAVVGETRVGPRCKACAWIEDRSWCRVERRLTQVYSLQAV